MGEQQPEMFTVQLSRRDSGISWGFRLQGGVDFKTPLSVQVVRYFHIYIKDLHTLFAKRIYAHNSYCLCYRFSD